MLAILLTAGCDGTRGRTPAGAGPQWLTEITDEAGLTFVHETGATGQLHLPEIMAGGAAIFDCDGDGRLDLYLTTGNGTLGPPGSGADSPNRLYRQQPDGGFSDVTEASGLGDRGYGMGVAVGDYDNDGDLDVYVTNYGPDRLYRNDGRPGEPAFEDVTEAAGIAVGGWSSSAAFFDYDRDGFLDLYVARYLVYDHLKKCSDRAGRPDYCNPRAFAPMHDVLLHNRGDGTFVDVSDRAGITSIPACAGLGVVCADLNDDGWQDVYVANDGYANQCWVNRGDGTFTDAAPVMGAARNAHGRVEAGMGVLAADLDNDADLDLFMTHLANETNTLYRNLGGSRGFEDATGASGLATSSVPLTGFGTAAFDIELDGDLDIVVVNGRVSRGMGPASGGGTGWGLYAEPNLFYLNRGEGNFESIHDRVAAWCDRVEITRGLAIGDLDGDGDLDVLITNVQGRARLYRNDAPRRGHWLVVRAVEPRLRRDAIGARIVVAAGGLEFMRTVGGGSSYLSSSDPGAHFGFGDAEAVDHVDVRWPDGERERFVIDGVDRSVELLRGEGVDTP